MALLMLAERMALEAGLGIAKLLPVVVPLLPPVGCARVSPAVSVIVKFVCGPAQFQVPMWTTAVLATYVAVASAFAPCAGDVASL